MLNLWTIIASLVGSGGLALLAVKWMAQRTIDHAFALNLESHKATLNEALEESKAALKVDADAAQARLEASLHRSNELMLGEEAAERSYRFEARKRLYTVIGPLRFQLISAAVDYRSRIQAVGEYGYSTSLTRYFGRSLLFRTGRLLALTELIERQMAHADFSADPATILLLRFRAQVLRALSSGDVPLDHPDTDWTNQSQHIFRDEIPIVAISMVTMSGELERVVRFDEFLSLVKDGTGPYLQPLAGLVDKLDATGTPIFWLRLLAIAEACGGLIEQEPVALALGPRNLDPSALLAASKDEHVSSNTAKYTRMLSEFRTEVAVPAAPKVWAEPAKAPPKNAAAPSAEA
jgi:hypothetical protein